MRALAASVGPLPVGEVLAVGYGVWVLVDSYSDKQDAPDLMHLRGKTLKELRYTLEAAGFIKLGDGYEAHHIVPWDKQDVVSRQMRKVLTKSGIDVHSAENLIWL